MGLIKRDKAGGALGALRRQKDIADKIAKGEAVSGAQEALVVLLDMSPSMGLHMDAATMDFRDPHRRRVEPGKKAWDAAVRATAALVDASTMSRVGVVAFCSKATAERRLGVGAKTTDILKWLRRWGPNQGLGTDFTCAINAGLDLLEQHSAARVRRMILMTDGCDGRHSGMGAKEHAEARLQSSGVVLDAVGFGKVNHEELERLTKIGRGVYHHTSDGAALVKTFKQLEAGIRGLLSADVNVGPPLNPRPGE